jgi:DNA-directed RNA polymerase specialized sigma24 family protein
MTPIIGDEQKPLGECISELKWFLRTALTNYESWDRITITKRHDYDVTGLKLRDRFVSYLEVLLAFDHLPWHQKSKIFQNLAEGMSQERIAEYHNCHPITVSRHVSDGLRAMVEVIWGS